MLMEWKTLEWNAERVLGKQPKHIQNPLYKEVRKACPHSQMLYRGSREQEPQAERLKAQSTPRITRNSFQEEYQA